MTTIHVTARLKIHEGKLDELTALAAEILQNVREKDNGTRRYDWFLNADDSECVVLEEYADSQALLDHLGHVGGQLRGDRSTRGSTA